MQIHGPSDTADIDTFTARLNPGTNEPFAVVEMGQVHFYAHTPEECDAAVRVWTAAKQLLVAAREIAQDDPEDEEDARFAAEAAELDELEPLPAPDVNGEDSGPEQVTS